MNLLQLQKGFKNFADKVLFSDASFAVNEGEHIGVIGPNGAGKTTLFKILIEQESLDSGEIVRSQQLRIGYLEQESDWSLDQTSEDYLQENCLKPIWELKQLGEDLGLTQWHFSQPLRSLSGGYRMRMKLLYLIGQEPNLMLLDEPTNFLDLESVLALEKFLQNYSGAFLLISHDREFLKRTTEATLEVEAGDITKFPGHIDDYFEQKAQLREILEAQSASQALKRKNIQDFVDRFGAKATKAKQAQSRMKQLDKMEEITLKQLPVRARIQIPSPSHTGKEVLSLLHADLGYTVANHSADSLIDESLTVSESSNEKRCILQNVNLRLERGMHLGIVGFNGAGKSTLLKSLAGRLPLLGGERSVGYQVKLSYFAQHVSDDLHSEDTVLQAMQSAAHPEVLAQEILNMAGSLLFSGDSVHKKIKVLSGGEKSRVALGQILLQKSPLLLMDEPTNHLDFETVEALTEALQNYPGTVIAVSHDRGFIGRISKQILEIRDGHVEMYPGTYDDYVWSLEKGALKSRYEKIENSKADKTSAALKTAMVSSLNDKSSVTNLSTVGNTNVNYKDETKRLQSLIKEHQRKISKGEDQIVILSKQRDQFNLDLITAQGASAQELAKQLGLCSKQIDLLEEQLLESMEALDKAETDLREFQVSRGGVK